MFEIYSLSSLTYRVPSLYFKSIYFNSFLRSKGKGVITEVLLTVDPRGPHFLLISLS